jgi:hypothetical protein
LEELIIGCGILPPDGFNAALQVGGVPKDDGGDDETEAAGPVALLVEAPVADFAETMEEDRPSESISYP